MSNHQNSKPSRGKKGGTCGAYAKNFPRSVAWAVDQDYVSKLSPEEREWLARFNDGYYGADFRGQSEELWPVLARRERYNAKNAANADFFAPMVREGQLVQLEDREEFLAGKADVKPTPGYLKSPEYKAKLEAYRSTLSKTRKPANPKDTPEHREASAQLHDFVHQQKQEPT